MKKIFGLLFAFVFLFCVWGTSVLAADHFCGNRAVKTGSE